MCGRFTLTADASKLQTTFPWLTVPDVSRIAPRYNIAPGHPVAVVPNDGLQRLEFFRWGFRPRGSKNSKRLINARAETLAEKPSFSTAYRQRRCLILADGFYEWQKQQGSHTKTPVYIQMRSGAPFAFAGLWESLVVPDGSILMSCVVVTTSPNQLVEPIHNRMPVILPAEAYETWLDSSEINPLALNSWLQPFPAWSMVAHAVSTLVNNPRSDSPDCVSPA